ncbi:MAG: DUF4255 domain-containing protein [Terrimicrobiaceae bacterium]
MIHDVLRLIVNQLNRSLGSSSDGESVVLGNIATVESAGDGGGGGGGAANLSRVVLSLVNITEDPTLKNGPHSHLRDGRIVYENRPVNLYLYLLFSANNPVYSTALTQLSRVIEFFQGQNVFTIRNSPDLVGVSLAADELAGLRIVVELQSLTFEQVNYLWGSLGGKQVPFVLYRARLISLTAGDIVSSGPPIEEIAVDSFSAFPP